MRSPRTSLIVLMLVIPCQSHSWGFYGHRNINRLAVFTLPTALMGFFKSHIEFISEHAVDPDMRRYVVKEEGARHFIDIDHYGDAPFETVPMQWDSAVSKYSEDTLLAYGIVPWHIERMYYRLVYAYRNKDIPFILKTATDLGHYIADAHVPLHTTENYNGQLTNQHGIHGLWESRLPELFAEDYDYFTGRAAFIQDPLMVIWNAIKHSHAAVDSVLSIERDLSNEFPVDRKYGFDQRGASTLKTYSRDFSEAYHRRLNGMVERRMRASIIAIGSFWYSAWIEAGQPDLSIPLTQAQQEALEVERKALEASRVNGNIKGRDHED